MTDSIQTSLDKTGSDGMNKGPDYSSAYCILETDSEHAGHGMVSEWAASTVPSSANTQGRPSRLVVAMSWCAQLSISSGLWWSERTSRS